ncbi:UNVERIFIED_CONTAM: hypothetical protein FKN15_041413 [Acipenser sinensis]
MAGLAFQCLKDSAELYDARLNEHVQHALGAVKAELVKAQDEKGLIGNVFSTPLAVQYAISWPPGRLNAIKKYFHLYAHLVTRHQTFSTQRFETVDSLWGPYLTTVLGMMTQQANQTYWQLIKSPDTPLIEGIADYKIEHGDMFILRKSKW